MTYISFRFPKTIDNLHFPNRGARLSSAFKLLKLDKYWFIGVRRFGGREHQRGASYEVRAIEIKLGILHVLYCTLPSKCPIILGHVVVVSIGSCWHLLAVYEVRGAVASLEETPKVAISQIDFSSAKLFSKAALLLVSGRFFLSQL